MRKSRSISKNKDLKQIDFAKKDDLRNKSVRGIEPK